MVHEPSIPDEPSMVGEASIAYEPSIPENIPTPTSYARNYQYEDASVPTEQEGPLDLTMKPKKQPSETNQHIPLPTERRKRISNLKEDVGIIYTKEETEDEAQEESDIIDDTTCCLALKVESHFQLNCTKTSMQNLCNKFQI